MLTPRLTFEPLLVYHFFHTLFDPINGFSTIVAPERPQCMRHTIHGSWVVNGTDFHSCFILNYVNISSTLYHFIIDSGRYLKPLSFRNHLLVLLVSIILLMSSQLITHVVENKQKKTVIMTSTLNIIYWDEKCRMLYPSSFLFMYFFTHEGSSSITSKNICFSIHIGLWMIEPECLHCAVIYTFIQRTTCFK